MLGTKDFAVFLATAIALNLMPGPDTLYIIARSVSQGRRAGVASVLAISSGSLVHATAAALGLSAILAGSAIAFSVVKWLGAVYLIYIGLQLMLQKGPTSGAAMPRPAPLWQVYRQGLLTNLLNPKVALFFLALLPQFVDPAAMHRELTLLFLGGVFIATGTLWRVVVVLATSAASKAMRATSASRLLVRRVTGGIFIAWVSSLQASANNSLQPTAYGGG